jgi:hypothetical protein
MEDPSGADQVFGWLREGHHSRLLNHVGATRSAEQVTRKLRPHTSTPPVASSFDLMIPHVGFGIVPGTRSHKHKRGDSVRVLPCHFEGAGARSGRSHHYQRGISRARTARRCAAHSSSESPSGRRRRDVGYGSDLLLPHPPVEREPVEKEERHELARGVLLLRPRASCASDIAFLAAADSLRLRPLGTGFLLTCPRADRRAVAQVREVLRQRRHFPFELPKAVFGTEAGEFLQVQ